MPKPTALLACQEGSQELKDIFSSLQIIYFPTQKKKNPISLTDFQETGGLFFGCQGPSSVSLGTDKKGALLHPCLHN